jgi:hypothetical protein
MADAHVGRSPARLEAHLAAQAAALAHDVVSHLDFLSSRLRALYTLPRRALYTLPRPDQVVLDGPRWREAARGGGITRAKYAEVPKSLRSH